MRYRKVTDDRYKPKPKPIARAKSEELSVAAVVGIGCPLCAYTKPTGKAERSWVQDAALCDFRGIAVPFRESFAESTGKRNSKSIS